MSDGKNKIELTESARAALPGQAPLKEEPAERAAPAPESTPPNLGVPVIKPFEQIKVPDDGVSINDAVTNEMERIASKDPQFKQLQNDAVKGYKTLENMRELVKSGVLDQSALDATAESLAGNTDKKIDSMLPGYSEAEQGIRSVAEAADSFRYPNQNTTPFDNKLQPAEYEKFRGMLKAAGPITLHQNNVESQELTPEQQLQSKTDPMMAQAGNKKQQERTQDEGRGSR